MATALGHEIEKRETTIVRVGGLAGFMIFGIYLVVTFALLELPPGGGAALTEPKTYISDQAGRMAIVNGLRNLVFFCLLFWAAGLYAFTRRSATLATDAWGFLGLAGAAAAAAVGIIANGVQGWRSGALPRWLVALGPHTFRRDPPYLHRYRLAPGGYGGHGRGF